MKMGGQGGGPFRGSAARRRVVDTDHDLAVHDSVPFGELADDKSKIPALSVAAQRRNILSMVPRIGIFLTMSSRSMLRH
ncbi:hypothetical protein ACX80M_18435 [Pseudarthrobacter sp. MDT1-22]